MEPKARHVLIGFFTAIVSVGIVVAVIVLGKFATTHNWQYFIVQFNESVSGLSNGSAVEYSGLKIGEVERLELQANPNIVNAYIKVQEGVEIQSDVRAMISMVGITGQSMIALSGGTKTSGRLIGTRDNRAIIYATPSPLSQLFSSGEGLVSSMSESLIGVKKLLSDENIESLGQILANVEAITATVADESDNIQSVIREAEGLLSSANAAVDVFAEFSSSVSQLVNEQGAKALSSMEEALGSVKVVADNIRKLVDNSQGSLATGLDGLEQLGPALNEFKRSMGTFNNFLRDFSESPGRFILEGQQLEEYKPW
ncbi:MAG: MCE family protein [Alcaligenaceae bacterium]|jgi:phospholipid/cholesterol/gamma-HCH transport system substrate-binding protein|nr:MCE family protein [Alcaligenaceae bacterium]HZJ97092.1 MlaD family protein [Oligella sp.]